MKIKIFLLTLLILISFPFSASADDISIDDPYQYTINSSGGYGGETAYINGATRGFCMHYYDRLFEDKVYSCQSPRAVWYYTNNLTSVPEGYDETWKRFNCWQTMYSTNSGYTTTYNNNPVLILKQSYQYFSTLPGDYDFEHPCKLKSVVTQEMCNINTQSIINLAFSQKFPLDLFIGLQGFSSTSTCPQFTIRNQTFQLCYILKIVKSLKYVLLLVFVLTSIIAL